MSILPDGGPADGVGSLAAFRVGFYGCLTARADALFELGDALLCHSGPVTSLPVLSLAGVFGRGHGGLYDALNSGRVDADRLRRLLAQRPIGRVRGRIVLAVDVTGWLRPDANCSPGRLYCHVTGHGRGQDQMVPGWAYSSIAALEPGATSWAQILDAQRLGPDDDAAEITAVQVRGTVERLVAAGQHRHGDAPIAIVVDAGYDVPRLAYQLRDLPVVVIGRLRSDRVLYRAAPAYAGVGRPQRHGAPFRLSDPSTWETPEAATVTGNARRAPLRMPGKTTKRDKTLAQRRNRLSRNQSSKKSSY